MNVPHSLGEALVYDGEWRDGISESDLRETFGAVLSYSSFRSPGFGESGEWYQPALLSGSDYSGGSVTVGIHETVGGYFTYSVVIHSSRLLDDDIRECSESLDDYPCIRECLLGE